MQQASPLHLAAHLLSIQPHESEGHFIFSLLPPSRPHYARRGMRRSLAGTGLIAVHHGCHSRRARSGPEPGPPRISSPPTFISASYSHPTLVISSVLLSPFFFSSFNCRFPRRRSHVLQLCILRVAAATQDNYRAENHSADWNINESCREMNKSFQKSKSGLAIVAHRYLLPSRHTNTELITARPDFAAACISSSSKPPPRFPRPLWVPAELL